MKRFVWPVYRPSVEWNIFYLAGKPAFGGERFKVKRENKLQEITQEEVAMPFLHLFAKGAQVLEAGLPFHLEDRHFAKFVSLND